MKKLRLITMLSALTLAAAGVFGSANLLKGKTAESVLADDGHSIAIGNSGKIYLQLNTDFWKTNDCKIGLYMFNDSLNKSAWGDLVRPSGTSRFVEYSYNLDFTPAQCIVFRVNPSCTSIGTWCWENYHSNDSVYNYTDNTDFKAVIWAGYGNGGDYNKKTESGAYDLDAVVKGGASSSWSVATVDTALTHAKVNGSDNIEVFGDVTLPANTYFKVVKGGSVWCGAYTAHSSISSNLNGGGANNIHNTSAATYEFYFDYDGETTYITDPVMAAADEWAQYFLNHVGCDASGVNTPSGWTACATEYAKLSGDAKNLVYGASAKEDGSYIEQAVARYDQALRSHPSLTKFIVNSSSQARGANIGVSPLATVSENSNMVIAIVIVSLVSVTAIGGYFFIKRRQTN